METSPLSFRPPRSLPTPGGEARASGIANAEAVRSSDKAVADDDAFGFLDILSMLNPLQYLPVVGSIYRGLTGDKIPETVSTIGSMVVSGLLGGPLGVAINAASTALQKLVGFDPDEVARSVLASIGLVSDLKDDRRTAALETRGTEAAGTAVPWSRAQRAAYRLAVDQPRSARTYAGLPVDDSEQVSRRHLAAAAYTRGGLAVMASGNTPLVDFSS